MPRVQDDLSNQRGPNEEGDLDECGLGAPVSIKPTQCRCGGVVEVGASHRLDFEHTSTNGDGSPSDGSTNAKMNALGALTLWVYDHEKLHMTESFE